MIIDTFCHLHIRNINFDISESYKLYNLEAVYSSSNDSDNYIRDNSSDLINDAEIILLGTIELVLDFVDWFQNTENNSIQIVSLSTTIEYIEQCNFEIPSAQLIRIARLGIPLGITCFSSE